MIDPCTYCNRICKGYECAYYEEACGVLHMAEDDCGGKCNVHEGGLCTQVTHWPMTVKVPKLVDGQVVLVDTDNILDGKFLIPQVYAFPVNEAGGGSVTVHKCTIKEGTEVEVGYKAVRDFIKHLGYDPIVICKALHFNEVIGVPF